MMKWWLLILANVFLLITSSAQNPAWLTFKVVDAESNRSIKNAKIKIPNTLLPEFGITDETKTIDLQQYQIVPGQILQTVLVTADKYEQRSIPPFVVQSGRDTLRIALLSKSSSSAGTNYFVYGIVQSADLLLRKDVPVVVYSGSKQFSATTDRFGYYFMKLKKSEVNASMRIVFECLPNSRRAMVRLWTSSGPSAKRSVRWLA